MPLTPNGKLDRRALPSPVSQEERTYTAPRTAAEKTMAQLWAEILELPQVGVDDNFFDLGGHSLLAMQLISRVRQDFGVELPLRRLFEAPTPAQLTTILVGLQAPASPTIRRVSREQHRRSTT